jgi:hypothetical protein
MYSNGFDNVYDNWKEKNLIGGYSKEPSLKTLQKNSCGDNNQINFMVSP